MPRRQHNGHIGVWIMILSVNIAALPVPFPKDQIAGQKQLLCGFPVTSCVYRLRELRIIRPLIAEYVDRALHYPLTHSLTEADSFLGHRLSSTITARAKLHKGHNISVIGVLWGYACVQHRL